MQAGHTKSLLAARAATLVATAVIVVGSIGPAEGSTVESISFSVGRFNYARDNSESELGVQLRFTPRRWKLAPMAGLAGTEEGARYVYGGLRREVPLDSHWALTPSFAVSLYDKGDGHDLGGPIEFRSALEISYQTSRRSRVGLAIYHLSNGVLYKQNPGSNSVILTLSLATSRR